MDQYTNFSQGGFDPSHGLTGMEMLAMIPSNHHHQIHHHHHPLSFDLRDGFFDSKPDFYQLNPPPPHQPQISKYLTPAKELLNEFCGLGGISAAPKGKKPCNVDGGSSSSSSLTHQALSSLDPFELQTRKSRLLSMLEEVDRRYARYCEQMRSTVSSFEAAAGEGAAAAYSKSASTAMSRHFRSLRDGIEVQVRATSKALGEKEPGTRGETPRLRMLEERIRRQKAMQQASAMESHPWRPQRGLPERSVSVLRAWLFEHFLHPYPSDVDKHILARQTGLSRSQVSNWFINARVRLWKPMVEEMYTEETKEQDEGVAADEDDNTSNQNPNPNPNSNISHDEKMVNDPGSLASVVSSSQPREYPTTGGSFTLLDQMDFAPYDRSFGGGGGGGGGGVSLTLGLQQHGGGGMSLSFSPATDEQSLFFARENIGEWDGDHQNLPYRNLMGTAPLLHDLAG